MGFHSLTIGKTALQAANYGLQVTGQNLSNINTAGYSRQRLIQSGAVYGVGYGNNRALGSGVNVQSVQRIFSAQAEKQLREATSADVHYGNLQTCYTNLQSYFGIGNYFMESGRTALSDAMNSFWNSLEDLSANAEALSSTSLIAEAAQTMASRFNEMDRQIREYRDDVNGSIEESVAQINNKLRTIAQLNQAIVQTESGGVTGVCANDLRDQRGETLRELSELVDVTVIDEKNGSCIVSLNGRTMVYHDQVQELEVRHESRGDISAAMPVFAKDGYPVKGGTGQLPALIEIRDQILPGYMEELDQLAAAFTWDFNRLYSQTRGSEPLDSAKGIYAPVDPSVTLDQLAYKTNIPDGSFQIVNGNMELVIYNRNTGQETVVPLEIDLDGRPGPGGEPDMILWDPADPAASHSFINRLQEKLNAAVPGGFKVEIDNDYRVSITANTDDYGFCFGKDTSGVVAALGLNVLFTGHNAGDIGVNAAVKENPQHFGRSKSFLSGDNSGIKDMLTLRDNGVARLKGMTPADYFRSTAGRLASEANRTTSQRNVKSDVLYRMFSQREQISGVSEDEETINLVMYQRAYQSAAKFISVVDGLYDTLLNM